MTVIQETSSYLNLSDGEFSERIRRAYGLMGPDCRLCPRKCGAPRREGEKGACGADDRLLVSSANLHFGEEPPISGKKGSGTLFVARCSLSCAYCQNYPISQLGHGTETTMDGLAEMMLRLQEGGAHNINWVTPTHEVPHLLDGLQRARQRGLEIPIVYNSSGYDSLEALTLLDGIVDIYLPDMRYADGKIALTYSGVSDYPEINRKAILEMHRQVGDLKLDRDGRALRGLLIRHLVLPGGLSGTREILSFVAGRVSKNTAISLMSQYFPAHKAPVMEPINRRITKREYQEAQEMMETYGLKKGWMQDMY